MTAASTKLVEALQPGDTLRSPFSGEALTVKSTAPGMYGLIEVTALDVDGDRHLLSLNPDESVEVTA